MVLILNIETSTKVCSVSLSENGETIARVEQKGEQYIHSEKLTLFIEELINKTPYSLSELSAIAVSKGPGSYTGLRIGVSCAKGLSYALNIPLLSVDSLDVLAECFLQKHKPLEDGVLYPMIDARRMEVFTKRIERKLNYSVEAKIIEKDTFSEEKGNVYIFGDGAEKCKDVLTQKNITIITDVETSSQGMEQLTYDRFINGKFENTAYFEPYYLKEFIAIPSRKKLL